MDRMKLYGTLALAALIGVAACDRAEQPAAGPQAEQEMFGAQEMDPELMAVMLEMQEIQRQLEPVQQRALEDEALAGRLEALSTRIDTAMREEDGELVERIEGFQGRLAAAEQAGDQAGVQALMSEVPALQRDAEALQLAVLERPDIRAEVEAFEAAHRARMIELEPEVEPLLDRVDELLADLDA